MGNPVAVKKRPELRHAADKFPGGAEVTLLG
jgi:hypothetical protein